MIRRLGAASVRLPAVTTTRPPVTTCMVAPRAGAAAPFHSTRLTAYTTRHVQAAPQAMLTRTMSVAANSGEAATEGQATKVPTKAEARAMGTTMSCLSNESLHVLAEQDHHDAAEERLIRNIMVVDDLEWHDARKAAQAIHEFNRQGLFMLTLPYKVGMVGWSVTALVSFPLVFSKDLALWFNEKYVTTDVPEDKDMETIWEIGGWTWNWWEPPMGTACFVVLALQMIRAQMLNMDLRFYSKWARDRRASRLVLQYPQYDEDILMTYARTAALHK